MARFIAVLQIRSGLLVTSLIALAACSAPVDEDDGSVPEFSGLPPGGGGLGAPPGQNAAVPSSSPAGGAPANTSPSSSEATGSSLGSIPVDSTGSSGSGSASGAGGAGGNAMTSNPPAPAAGAGGGAMAGNQGTPGNGAGGNAMPGDGNVPPVTPPPVTTPPAGAGCGANAIFCEDFDDFNLGALNGTVNGLRVDRVADIVDEPGRGRVLRAQGGTGYGNKSGVFLDNFAPPDNSFFGRAYIRVDQFPTAGGDHWVIVEATNNGAGEQVRPVGGQFSRWAPGSDGPSAGDWTDWQQSNAATSGGAWECVEWQINGANGANDMVLWVNGTEVQPLDRGGFRLPAINRLWFGWVVFQNGQPPTHEVRFDDIVLSRERVGCD
jgi:hypothetical protein